MLSANSDLQRRPGLATAFRCHLHQLSHAFLIERCERILLQDALGQICRKHLVHVVAREAERGLRQIVCAEGEELRLLGNLVCHQRGARQLNHGADHILNFGSLLFEYFVRHSPHDRRLVRHFFHRGDQRNHDFGKHFHTFFSDLDCRFENGARLHLGNFRIGDAEPAAAMPEHGIELVQLLHSRQQRGQKLFQIADTVCAVIGISLEERFLLLCVGMGKRGDFHHQILAARQELVQRWVQRTDRDG